MHFTREEKDSVNHFSQMVHFMDKYCKMRSHWCDGTPIPEDAREYPSRTDVNRRKPCMYHDADRGCMHPKRPRRTNGTTDTTV